MEEIQNIQGNIENIPIKKKAGRPKNPTDDKGKILKILRKIYENPNETASNRINAIDEFAVIQGWKKVVNSGENGAVSSIHFIPKKPATTDTKNYERSKLFESKPITCPPANTNLENAPVTKDIKKIESILNVELKDTTDSQECKPKGNGYTEEDISDFLKDM